ncbi:phosphatidylethanolamine-binding protein 4 isoform X1 [Dendropsophus ebraccatus]|uniref:phosphatidylethanolamine-binding protein 4 isoform X1 n=1 Tax=Dendropsophus ebraccatus TaxID=150705 RepID=UPI00383125AD
MWHLCFLQVTMWQALLLTGHLLSVGLFSVVRASCDPQPITGEDAEFCSDDLQVEYGSLGDMSCQKVTLCENVIQYLKEAPQFTYSKAQEDKVYVLIMVDPDAPSREDPIRGPWRHWLVADIQGPDLLAGKIFEGRIIEAYRGPSPPPNTGYHRYQFLLYLQPPGSSPALLSSEETFRGNFKIDDFVSRFSLGDPVVTTQFMAQNIQQKAL